ncbi:hypothetical protein [Streptomyces sp. cg35]|uniref:hypothetical protein n=1 Tax=Streptomyces sp. cg35 TaxID=3421650 RepID=UPI003D176331
MRLRRPIVLGLTAAALALAPAGPAPAADGLLPGRACAASCGAAAGADARARDAGPAAPVREPVCEISPDSGDFPIDTEIHKGPSDYHPGGGYGRWSLDLTNTTASACSAVHPVLVFVDRQRSLRPRQIQLEFDDGTRWRPVRFEETGRHEHVGVFDDGFPGFSVGPGETVTVQVRLAFTSDTRPDHVVVDAALVQRRDDDGDWVGESDDYPFDIVPDEGGDGYGDRLGSGLPGQLARTGPGGALLGLGATSVALLLGGVALMAGSRRLRPGRR